MADTTLSPEALAAIISSVKELVGTVFIGYTLGTILYGITCLQAYLYYKNYPKDAWYLKSFVALLWFLDSFTTALVAHSIYTYVVFDLTNPAADLTIPWTFVIENEVVDIITLLTQLFFLIQLWKLPCNRYYCLAILAIALAAFGISIPLTAHIFEAHRQAAALAQRNVYVLGSVGQGLLALCDILITAGLIYYLRGWRRGYKNITRLVDNLILYIVTRGSLTAICQLMFMALNVSMPSHTFWQPFHLTVGKLYVNSVLASFNFRMEEEQPTEYALDKIDAERQQSKTLAGLPTLPDQSSGTVNRSMAASTEEERAAA